MDELYLARAFLALGKVGKFTSSPTPSARSSTVTGLMTSRSGGIDTVGYPRTNRSGVRR